MRLDRIADNQSQKGETIRDAKNISNKVKELQLVLMLNMWNIKFSLHRSRSLRKKMDLKTCANIDHSLISYLF